MYLPCISQVVKQAVAAAQPTPSKKYAALVVEYRDEDYSVHASDSLCISRVSPRYAALVVEYRDEAAAEGEKLKRAKGVKAPLSVQLGEVLATKKIELTALMY